VTPIVWALSLVFMTVGQSSLPSEPGPRRPNPLAPSLPLLTEKEEAFLDGIIDRFIQFDTGRLAGAEGKKAVADFQKLGPEAIPALIRGLNRAARIEASCPAVTIARKLAGLLKSSQDVELLEFARENIGAGVTESRHKAVLNDLRVTCMFRKRAVGSGTRVLKTMALPAYLEAVTPPRLVFQESNLEPGPQRDRLLQEMDKRPPGDFLADLGSVAADASNAKLQKWARDLLEDYFSRREADDLKQSLRKGSVEVRAAATRAVARKQLHLERELIELLADVSADMRQTARQALVRLNPGVDFGPQPEDEPAERARAVGKWRDWLGRQSDR
jgi:hypothetical protein